MCMRIIDVCSLISVSHFVAVPSGLGGMVAWCCAGAHQCYPNNICSGFVETNISM